MRLPADKIKIIKELRVSEKKSLREITRLTGVSLPTVQRLCKKSGWPNPQDELAELNEILQPVTAQKAISKSSSKSSANVQTTININKNNDNQVSKQLLNNLPEIDYNKPVNEVVKQVFLWSMRIVQNSAQYSVSSAIKLMEITSRLMSQMPEETDNRKLTILIPEITESYREAPEEEKEHDELNNPTERSDMEASPRTSDESASN